MAAAFAGCSQDELVYESMEQDLGNRPMVEAPVIKLAGADTKMSAEETSAAGFAKVIWEKGDGFGACVMDEYVSGAGTWATLFPIQNYISSNILYKTEDGVTFGAEASLAQGNYLFYAPFNEANFKREALKVKLPTVQNVTANAGGMPSNSAIKQFMEDKESVVFVAYDSIWNTPKTELSLKFKHIQALPMVTLKLGNVRLLDENGVLKNDGATPVANPVYETSIKVDSIVFVNTGTTKIMTAGTIDNANLVAKLNVPKNKTVCAWDEAKFENAATADVVNAAPAAAGGQERVKVVFDEEGGRNVTAAGTSFFMVLPAASYAAADLAVEVYTTINGEAYVLATTSAGGTLQTAAPSKAVRLLPGLPYSADEYNKDGSIKTSKGTSFTYTIAGGFVPKDKVAATGYTSIKNYQDLVNYVTNVAYRGEDLIEITEPMAQQFKARNGVWPDIRKYFVVETKANETIELDDAFVNTFNNACVITDAGGTAAGTINFRRDNNRVTLGNINFDVKTTRFKFNSNYSYTGGSTLTAGISNEGSLVITGAATLTGAAGATYSWKRINVLTNAELTLASTLINTTRVNNYGGTVNVNTASACELTNTQGTANINVDNAGTIKNGPATDVDATDKIDIYATMNINSGVTVTVNENTAWGEVVVDKAVATLTTNNGLVTVSKYAAKVTVAGGNGKVDNTVAGKVNKTGGNNVVYATLGAMTNDNELKKYDALTGLTKLVLTGEWTLTSDYNLATANGSALATVTAIDFNAGSGLSLGNATLTIGNVTAITINANTVWSGRDALTSKIVGKTSPNTAVIKTVNTATGTAYSLTKSDITATNITGV